MNYTARQKLNWNYLSTILMVSGVVALIFQSWPAFFVTAGILFVLSVRNKEIRLRNHQNW